MSTPDGIFKWCTDPGKSLSVVPSPPPPNHFDQGVTPGFTSFSVKSLWVKKCRVRYVIYVDSDTSFVVNFDNFLLKTNAIDPTVCYYSYGF